MTSFGYKHGSIPWVDCAHNIQIRALAVDDLKSCTSVPFLELQSYLELSRCNGIKATMVFDTPTYYSQNKRTMSKTKRVNAPTSVP